ncbi:MAG TPA: hypothetical protein VJ728_18110 [Candidatus Binataceae bacterium]|nr:hypothetical protein [Candidatus Binataceae bacterium]
MVLIDAAKQVVAISETSQEQYYAQNCKADMETGTHELTKQQRAYGDVRQIANRVGSPLALFRSQHEES